MQATYGLMPIVGSNIQTYSSHLKDPSVPHLEDGVTINLVAIEDISDDGKKLYINPFDFQSNEVYNKIDDIVNSCFMGTVQIAKDFKGHVITLQVVPPIKNEISNTPEICIRDKDSEMKICDIQLVHPFDLKTYYAIKSDIFDRWHEAANEKFALAPAPIQAPQNKSAPKISSALPSNKSQDQKMAHGISPLPQKNQQNLPATPNKPLKSEGKLAKVIHPQLSYRSLKTNF